MRRVRTLGPASLLGVALVAAAGIAWITRYPDGELAHRASHWPLVGGAVRDLRALYLPPGGPPGGDVEGAGQPSMAGSWSPPPLPLGRVWLAPGTVLRALPEEMARPLSVLSTPVEAPHYERRGDWYRVLARGDEGWVLLPGYDPSQWPPFGSDPDPVRPLSPQPPDEERLRRAIELLGGEARQVPRGAIGGYSLYTDAQGGDLVDELIAVGEGLEETYRRRYGVAPLGSPLEAVVLFSREAAYRELERSEPGLRQRHTSGHAAKGVVTTFVGGRSDDEVVSTVVHELVHLLNRRSIGPALPPWLEEGLADDLADSRRCEGALEAGVVGGEAVRLEGGRIELRGGRAALRTLGRELRAGRLLTLRELLALDAGSFGGPAVVRNYAHASFFVRYLSSGTAPALPAGFRAFLAAVAVGEPPTPERLIAALGVSWEELELGFRSWLAALVASAESPPAGSGGVSARDCA